MQNLKKISFLFLFLAILAPTLVLADSSATHKYTITMPDMSEAVVSIESSYSGKYLLECNIHLLARGVGKDCREFFLTFVKQHEIEVKTNFTFLLRDNDGGAIRELRVEEAVVCSGEECTIRRSIPRGRAYSEGDPITPDFSEVKEPRTQALELFGRMLVGWAMSNDDPSAGYRLESEFRELGLQRFIKDFAETPFEAYLGK